MSRHVAVWMDGEEASVFHVRAKGLDEATVYSPEHRVRRRNHSDDQHRFFQRLACTLKDAERILVLGPSTTKLSFLRYLQKCDPALEARIVGLETADHPSDGQIAAHVRRYFWSRYGASQSASQ
jgi:stalled ribosome rescue protein Dom34